MSSKGILYAEEDLAVHSVYEEAKQALVQLRSISDSLLEITGKKRFVTEMISDREVDLVSDERGKHADMSQAAMERHLKGVFRHDPTLSDLRSQLVNIIFEQDSLEYRLREVEHTIRVLTARLTELGGYLHYLAAIKASSQS